MLGTIWEASKRFRQEIRQRQINELKVKIRKRFYATSSKVRKVCQLCEKGTLLQTSQPQIMNLPLKQQCQYLFTLIETEDKFCPLHELQLVSWSKDFVRDYPILFGQFCKQKQWSCLPPVVLRRILKWIFEILIHPKLQNLLLQTIIHSNICQAIMSGIMTVELNCSEMQDRILEQFVRQIQLILLNQYPLIIAIYPYHSTLQNLLNLNQSRINLIVYNSICSFLEFKQEINESDHIKGRIKAIANSYVLSKKGFSKVSEQEIQAMINVIYKLLNSHDKQLNFNQIQCMEKVVLWCVAFLNERSSRIMQKFLIWIFQKQYTRKNHFLKICEELAQHRKNENIYLILKQISSGMDIQQ